MSEEDNNLSRGGIVVVSIFFVAALACLLVDQLLVRSGEYAQFSGIAWSLFLIIALAAVGLTFILILNYFHQMCASSVSIVADLRRLLTGQAHSEAVMTQITENLLLSESIKSVAFRDNDRTVLENAIKEDIRREKWQTADRLIDEYEKRFGLKEQVAAFREDLNKHQNATTQEKIESGIENIESLWIIHRYDDAQKEVDALVRLYPESNDVKALQGQTEKRKQDHKKELLDRWEKATQANDVEQGVDILKLLDGYLSPSEAAALRETARGVFRAKLQNMGVQFSLYVTEKKWHQALKIGREIISEYPNSRMAQEVREKLEILKSRATSGS